MAGMNNNPAPRLGRATSKRAPGPDTSQPAEGLLEGAHAQSRYLSVSAQSRPRSGSCSTTETSKSGAPRSFDLFSQQSHEDYQETQLSSHHGELQLRSAQPSPLERPSPYPEAFVNPLQEIESLSLDRQDHINETSDLLINEIYRPVNGESGEGLGVLKAGLDREIGHNSVKGRPKVSRQKRLRNRLYVKAVGSCGPDSSNSSQSFYPPSVLFDLINAVTVEEELHRSTEWPSEYIAKVASSICAEEDLGRTVKSFKPIFALLVLSGQVSTIDKFIFVDGISNLDLPLEKVLDEDGHVANLRRRDPVNGEVLRCFDDWELPEIDNFYQNQRKFTAHYFRRSKYDDVSLADLDSMTVLPFTTPAGCSGRDDISLGEGGSGDVMKCFIHPEYHDFEDADDIAERGVAVKRLKKKTLPSVFERELKILGKFCGFGTNNHIVSLLGAYKQHGYCHLIFPRADMNLFEYWERYPEAQSQSHDCMVWVSKQCYGLSKALHIIHRHKTIEKQAHKEGLKHNPPQDQVKEMEIPRVSEKRMPDTFGVDRTTIVEGLHGDIKPENLLVYQKNEPGCRGVIKIADFGEAEMTPTFVGSRKRQEVQLTPTYRAPECDLRPNYVRAASDIWSLGCVFLHLVTWVLGGMDYLNEFSKIRRKDDIFDEVSNQGSDTFFEIATSFREGQTVLGIRVKPEVTKFIHDLHKHERCTRFLHDLLELIEREMLLADSSERKRCNFHSKLKKLYKKCEKDTSYATKPSLWENLPKPIVLVELHKPDVEDVPSVQIAYSMNRLAQHDGTVVECQRCTDATRWKPPLPRA